MNGENDKISVSITLPEDLIRQIDKRAAKLDLNRSQYLRRVARKDLGTPLPEETKLQEKAVAA